MNKNDYLQRFLFENISIRGEIVHLNESYQTIIEQHNYPPIIKQLLGEALAVVVLLSAVIKFKGRLTLQFQGKNKLKLILVQCNDQFHIRALAQWHGDLDPEGILEDLQNGVLAIIMDPDSTVNRYQGIVSFKGNSLAESIEGYFQDSEQLPTRIWIAISDDKAAGLFLQALPGEEKENAELNWEHITTLTETVKPEELLNLDSETLLQRLYVEEDVRLFEPEPVIFNCTCSAKRGENAILLLGREETEAELNEKQVVVVKCDFCNREFVFDRVDVENIFRQSGDPPTSTQIH